LAERATLSRARRLLRRADFLRIQAGGKRVVTRHFVLLVAARLDAPAGSVPPARLGLVASRRVGGAVERNRAKRLCKECFRLGRSRGTPPTREEWLPPGVDLVVIVREGADRLKLQQVTAEWEGARKQLKRLATEALARTAEQPHVSAAEGVGPRPIR
jgi:ribonuclease P protein component